MGKVFHALVLNLHQPAGNLEALLDSKEWKAKEILLAMDRIPRSLWSYEDVGRVHDYLKQHEAHGEVHVQTGAWNTGWHSGVGFTQWTASQGQKDALKRVAETSQTFHAARQRAEASGTDNLELQPRFSEAHWRLLRAQTSCNFFWGEAWVPRCHKDLDEAWAILRSLHAR